MGFLDTLCVWLPLLLLKEFQSFLHKSFLLWLESLGSVSGDDGSEFDHGVEFECALNSFWEITSLIQVFVHVSICIGGTCLTTSTLVTSSRR